MKLTELIQEYETELGKDAEAALRSVDWNYDVDPFDSKRFDRGQKVMSAAKTSLKELHSKSPDAATKLWMQHCPYARGGIPSWILA
jgi:hypothetical protein